MRARSHCAEQIIDMSLVLAKRCHVLKCVDEAEIWIFQILTCDSSVGDLDIQICDMILEDGDLIGMHVLQIFIA